MFQDSMSLSWETRQALQFCEETYVSHVQWLKRMRSSVVGCRSWNAYEHEFSCKSKINHSIIGV